MPTDKHIHYVYFYSGSQLLKITNRGQMIMRNAAFFFSIFAAFLISLPGALMAEIAFDPETAQIYLPAPLTPQLTADGKTLRHGVPLKAVVADPDPAAPRRKIPAPAGLTAAPEAATASFSISYVPDGGNRSLGRVVLYVSGRRQRRL
jgi:hypothetical protein